MGASDVRWFVYVARCADGTLYTGTARDVSVRLAAHNAGKGARYTRGRGPLQLCAKQRCASQGDALRLELAIKRLTREAKVALLGPRQLGRFARAVWGRSWRAAVPGADVGPSAKRGAGRRARSSVAVRTGADALG